MAKVTVAKAAGLRTAPNKLTLPEGAFTTATNAIIRGKNIVEPRRGYKQEAARAGSGDTRVKAFTYYNGGKVVWYTGGGSDKLAYTSDDGAAYTDYSSTYTPPDTATLRIKFAELNENLYWTTTVGAKLLTSLTATPAVAGVPAPTALVPAGNSPLTGDPDADGSWLPADSAVAYRAVFGIKDANDNVKLGAPSGRYVAINPADVVGDLARVTDVVTVTVAGHMFVGGDLSADKFTISPGDGNFTAGATETVSSGAATTATTFTYSDTGSDATLADQTISSGTKKTALRVYLPSGLSTSYFIRLYRSASTPAANVAPDDELFQVYEATLTSTNISNGYVDITDNRPEEMLGDPLYTNPRTGAGILDANAPPPIGKDLCGWQERLWWSNTKQRHTLDFQLLGVGSPDGLQDDDVICIGTRAYMVVEGTNGDQGWEFDTVSSSLSKNIDTAVRSLAKEAATLEATDGTHLLLTSSEDGPPGMARVVRTALGGSAVYLGASRPASWNPTMPTAFELASGTSTGSVVTLETGAAHGLSVGQQVVVAILTQGGIPKTPEANYPVGVKTVASTPTSTTFTYAEAGSTTAMVTAENYYVYPTTLASTNDEQVHAVYYSKYQEPEAVPLLNYVYVGARNKAILRIVPLRDRLYVFKEDGIYTVTGNAPNLRVDELDRTCWLVAPDSVVAVNNGLYALTNKGVVVINEAGVGIISDDIRDVIDTALSPAVRSVTKVQTWGASYESENLYLLALNQASSDTSPSIIMVYNVLERVWVKWNLARWFGAVDPDTDKLCLTGGAHQYGLNERKTYDYTDYADDETSVTISTATGTSITFSAPLAATVGDVVSQGSVKSVITAVVSSTVVTVAEGGFSAGAATIFGGYHVTLEYGPQHAGAPSQAKHFSDVTLHFNKANINTFTGTFRTELSTSSATTTLTTAGFTTGAAPSTLINAPMMVPLEKQRGDYCHIGLNVREAYAVWQLNGYTATIDVCDDGASR